ncbi:hypothetical protein [Flavobacterium sp. FlaQc-50]|jgi:hypothetical protein|uniref:hypothetical protein n=1 Tax=unclassified Flavobacterium TaxID=196869 RepID=UPI00375734C4
MAGILQNTVFGKKNYKNKIEYNLYFKTKSNAATYSINFPKYTKTVGKIIYVKIVGMVSNHVYYNGLHTDNQTFDLSYNNINEEIGYYISTKEFYTNFIDLNNKSITYINFSIIITTWDSSQQLLNNDITTTIYGGFHNNSTLAGYDFNNNANFTKDLLPPDNVGNIKIKSLGLSKTKIYDVTEILADYQNLGYLSIGNATDVFDFTVPISHPKLNRLDLDFITQKIPDLTFKNCPSLKNLIAVYPRIFNISIENCPVLESISNWGNKDISDINRIGNSKFKGLAISPNTFTPKIKDKIIDYCISDEVLNGTLYIGTTFNAPTNTEGLTTLRSRGWTIQ